VLHKTYDTIMYNNTSSHLDSIHDRVHLLVTRAGGKKRKAQGEEPDEAGPAAAKRKKTAPAAKKPKVSTAAKPAPTTKKGKAAAAAAAAEEHVVAGADEGADDQGEEGLAAGESARRFPTHALYTGHSDMRRVATWCLCVCMDTPLGRMLPVYNNNNPLPVRVILDLKTPIAIALQNCSLGPLSQQAMRRRAASR